MKISKKLSLPPYPFAFRISFENNYNLIISNKKSDHLKSKEDVDVSEAFELYMINRFHGIKLDNLSSKILKFWQDDFDKSIEKHINFLKKNLEDQTKSLKASSQNENKIKSKKKENKATVKKKAKKVSKK